jgi:uncharacterized protein YecE (DUF72 family)
MGCSGWSYDEWKGHFYPRRIETRNYLDYYGRVFDYVEIDSSFYRTPNRNTTVKWATVTPPDFRFTAKFPQVVTHETRLGGGLDGLLHFFEMMKPLENKMLALLIQLPGSLTKDEGLPKLERLIPHLWKKYRYAIEVQHKSWFTPEVFRLLEDHSICLAWSQLDSIETPAVLTTDFFYLRLIGDRSVDEKNFEMIQKDREAEMRKWAKVVKNVRGKVAFGIVAANNHYAGSGPNAANGFRKMIGLPEVMWKEMKQAQHG